MKCTIKASNHQLTPDQKSYIEGKIAKLERYLERIQDARVQLRHESLRGAGETFRVEVTLIAEHGIIVRAEEQSKDLLTAVDLVHDNLQRQITRFKEKHYRRGKLRRANGQIVSGLPALTEEERLLERTVTLAEDERHIVRTKAVNLKPMFSDEAIEQMELLGHTFFVFRDAETEEISVVYRRNDGNYGLITPS
jgi:putative sigma-54 modulation protein